jgi:hypothetical protein
MTASIDDTLIPLDDLPEAALIAIAEELFLKMDDAEADDAQS